MKQTVPTPELLYRQSQHNPTFIKIINSSESSVVTDNDYIFAYNEKNKCFGSRVIKDQVLPVWGADLETDGFAVKGVISLGLYDSETNKFYELEGKTTDWLTKEKTDLKWQPLGLYQFEITGIGNEIGLIADPELSEVEVKINTNAESVKQGDKVFIKLESKNTDQPMLLSNGNGTLEEVKRWVSGFGWVTHIYTPAEGDNNIIFNAVGLSAFSKGMVTSQATVKVEATVKQPEPQGDLFSYKNQEFGFKLEERIRGSLKLLYLIADNDIEYRLIMEREQDEKLFKQLNGGRVEAGDEKLVIPSEMNGTVLKSLDFQFINGKRVKLKIEL